MWIGHTTGSSALGSKQPPRWTNVPTVPCGGGSLVFCPTEKVPKTVWSITVYLLFPWWDVGYNWIGYCYSHALCERRPYNNNININQIQEVLLVLVLVLPVVALALVMTNKNHLVYQVLRVVVVVIVVIVAGSPPPPPPQQQQRLFQHISRPQNLSLFPWSFKLDYVWHFIVLAFPLFGAPRRVGCSLEYTDNIKYNHNNRNCVISTAETIATTTGTTYCFPSCATRPVFYIMPSPPKLSPRWHTFVPLAWGPLSSGGHHHHQSTTTTTTMMACGLGNRNRRNSSSATTLVPSGNDNNNESRIRKVFLCCCYL